MKNIISLFVVLFLSFIYNNAKAQCGATSVSADPQPVMVCGGDTAIINFTATGTCAGAYEYEVLIGATVIQTWNVATFFNASPSTSTTYTVNVRCNACPATISTVDFLVDVVEEPIISGITEVCSGGITTLTATGSNGTQTWWDSQVGGTQLSATGDYTTPALAADQTYWVHVSGAVSGGGGSILITECGLDGAAGGTGSEDYVEISNLYTTAINTAGWVVAVSDSYTAINSVNNNLWNLPGSFTPCSVMTRTDVAGTPNYWGSNIFWNSTSSSWTIIIDNVGNVVDFIAWGWTAADLAGFNPTINGFSITLGAEWVGNGCVLPCGSVGATQYSYARTGSTDNNAAGDFVCQPTSVDLVNPGLTCGWSASASCPYPVTVLVDIAPTASNPAAINVECIGDVPLPDVLVVDDEADDVTMLPTVSFISDVSDGLTCPETITRTYRVMDTCSNFIDVTQTITINDITAPVFAVAPGATMVQCSGDVPVMANLAWTDNCDGAGSVSGTDVSDNNSCPETITRTWTYTDACGNNSSTSQIITVNDITPPTASNPIGFQLVALPAPDPLVVNDESDNCGATTVLFVNDVSDNGFCPEIVTRYYSVTDDCGNEIIVTQEFEIGDPTPDAYFIASETFLSNFETEVDFTNLTTGAVNYEWDFGDGSPISTEENPTYTFPDEESGGYIVELIAYSPFGCSDTARLIIQVKEELIYYIPNAFTPDGDEFNQTFQPIFTSGIDPYDFSMLIYNRWGELMFETYDPSIGWDGTYHGKLVPDGMYVWKIKIKLSDLDDRDTFNGHVSIIR